MNKEITTALTNLNLALSDLEFRGVKTAHTLWGDQIETENYSIDIKASFAVNIDNDDYVSTRIRIEVFDVFDKEGNELGCNLTDQQIIKALEL